MANSVFTGEFDQLDRAILEELQINGRITVADLGRKIHLSPPAVYQRIKRMERARLIRGYTVEIDQEMAGYHLLCFIRLTLHPHSRELLDSLQAHITQLAGVVECYHTAGSYDVLLKVLVTDHRMLDQLVKDKLMTTPGVTRVETDVVLSVMKATTAIKLV
ncbi:MAG: Lrp/AsnC family transcriptional regulator [Anaerolineae bacterium]|nr:Lrp/AsnC family transcriptional regulator [Anaerolineae bacterium]